MIFQYFHQLDLNTLELLPIAFLFKKERLVITDVSRINKLISSYKPAEIGVTTISNADNCDYSSEGNVRKDPLDGDTWHDIRHMDVYCLDIKPKTKISKHQMKEMIDFLFNCSIVNKRFYEQKIASSQEELAKYESELEKEEKMFQIIDQKIYKA